MERDGDWLIWKVPVPAGTAEDEPVAEFVITDGEGNWDKPADGGNYVVISQGTWALRDGELTRLDGNESC